jgi:hypothetical protein
MIEKLLNEDVKKKTHSSTHCESELKKCRFLTWNKEVVDDKKIFDDLRELSKGKLDISEDFLKLIESRNVLHNRKNKTNQIKRK